MQRIMYNSESSRFMEDELACFVNQMINNPLYQSQRFCHSCLGVVVARMSLQKAER